jgi:hypothetical protein
MIEILQACRKFQKIAAAAPKMDAENGPSNSGIWTDRDPNHQDPTLLIAKTEFAP